MVNKKEGFDMNTLKKTLIAICVAATIGCGVRQPVAPMPEDFKAATVNRVFLPGLGHTAILSDEDGLVGVIRQYGVDYSNLRATWELENGPNAKRHIGDYTLSPEAQQYAKQMQEAGAKLAYELTRIKYEADSAAKK